MRRKAGIIAGASVAAVTLVIASQIGLFARHSAPEPTETRSASVEPAPEPPAPVPSPAALAEIARLTQLLTAREEAYAKAIATIKTRDGEAARLTTLLAERDAELSKLRAELAEVRSELDNLRVEAALLVKTEPLTEPELVSAPAPADAMTVVDIRPDRLTAVHFDPSSSRLSPGGQAHAAAAAVMLSDMKIAGIKVIGYTDTTGNPERNRRLAEARARAVADFLIRAGLPADVIQIEGMGEDGAPVATANGVTEPLNRCAEIVAIPL